MEGIYTRPLTDDELLVHLELGASIVFDERMVQWHEIERQVEKLGFGDLYIVSATHGPLGNNPKISLKPDLQRRSHSPKGSLVSSFGGI